jgi:two-component system, cell cycle response regulator
MAASVGPRALVVEDDEDVRQLLIDTISLRSYETIGVNDGTQGIQAVQASCPDLVLLDIGLPDMSGLDVLQRVKGMCARTAVVIVTGRTNLDVAVRALNMGADGYVTKPFLVDELLAVVDRARERQTLLSELERLAITDGLTGLSNRRHFEDELREEEVRAQRYGTPVAVVMIDMNHLKLINDNYGHAEGDAILKEAAELIRDTARSADTVARYGGDEIALILPETTDREASAFILRLRRAIRERNLRNPEPELSMAIGYSSRPPCPSLHTALNRADERMYRDKARQVGRNIRSIRGDFRDEDDDRVEADS